MPIAPTSEDIAAKAFTPSEAKAGVYIYRASSMGMSQLYDVALDGNLLGGIAPGTYHHVEVASGEHRISVSSRLNQETTKFVAKSGSNYFFEVSGDVGIFLATVSLDAVTEEAKAKAVVQSLKLAQRF